VISLEQIGDTRYVGDRDSMFVHDTWSRESETCLLDELARSGNAVRFEPDTLEQAFDEGFDYCDTCVGKEDPASPELRAGRSRALSCTR
jgi:hypothetical protein